jgi:hypothetical protein|tara:strand:- start:748 stop:1179 length:432 start_codon:yes stop_codon:yes gene_type:complete
MIKSRAESFRRKKTGELLQVWAARYLKSNIPELEDQDVKSIPMSQRGEDLLLTVKGREILCNSSFECKSTQRGLKTIYDNLEQAKNNKIVGDLNIPRDQLVPILVMHDPKKEDVLAIMSFKNFVSLMKKIRTDIGETDADRLI